MATRFIGCLVALSAVLLGVLMVPPSTRIATKDELDMFYTGWGGYLDETLAQVS